MFKIKMTEPYPCDAKKAYEISIEDYDGAEDFLPNIEKMEKLSFETTEDGHEKRLFRFRAISPIPKIASDIFKPEMLQWDQELVLYPEELRIDWKVMPHFYTEYIHCYGKTFFKEKQNRSIVEVSGIIRLDPAPIPGIPDAVVRQAIKVVEPFVGTMITPNLRKFYRAIKRMAKAKGKLQM